MTTLRLISLDLHGVKHIDVENTVKRFLEDQWDKLGPLKIITGNSPEMKALVTPVLEAYGLDPMESGGTILAI